MSKSKHQSHAVTDAIKLAGGPSAVARRFDISNPWAVSKWIRAGRIPADRIIGVAGMVDYQITPHQIDPAIYPHPDDGLPEALRKGLCGDKAAA